ncbi:MAG: hypothetical protein HDQ95_00170 [Roseburia sp.]|nr:hypothetical protein [Roseburia sp.]
MNKRGQRWRFLLGGLCAIILNAEPLYLGGIQVSNTYTSLTFSLDYFLSHKQFLVSIKLLFVAFVFCFLYGVQIRKKYTVYTFLRLRNKERWMFGQFMQVWCDALLFFGIYAAVTFGICAVGCREFPVVSDIWIVLMSLFAFSYMGSIFAIIVNGTSFFIKAKNAMVLGYVCMILLAFLSMAGSDFLGRNPLLMYSNPITSMSMADCNDARMVIAGIGACVTVSLLLSWILACFCVRTEHVWEA